ncbi:hypothetical protein [Roseiconus lacunae]|uniref:hypothetical protein n=1 Tax=Roseiconus lacunae TaxID=2605694 RepID=UPI001E2EFA15|nr:hypothetical protein [Roseiconus lacunae]MCD0457887.1 hypothetical protein [Roseiconus lacunae]
MIETKEIDDEDIARAKAVLFQILDRADTNHQSFTSFHSDGPACNQLNRAKQLREKTLALQAEARKARTEYERLREMQSKIESAMNRSVISEDQRGEIDKLREMLLKRIRSRAEEIVARSYPANSPAPKKSPARLRRYTV